MLNGGVKYRVDQLANRIAFERSLASAALLATPRAEADGSARGKYGSADTSADRELRPHETIVQAITAAAAVADAGADAGLCTVHSSILLMCACCAGTCNISHVEV